jgi:replicative DNA helicase
MTAVIPSAPKAEQAVLGAAFIDRTAPERSGLSAGDFHDPRHRAIWAAVEACVEAKRPIDPATVEDELLKSGRLDAVGGLAYVAELAIAAVTADNVEHYADTLRAKRAARDVLVALDEAATEIRRSALDGDDAITAANEIVGRVAQARPPRRAPVSLRDLAKLEASAIVEDVQAAERGQVGTTRISSGLVTFDAQTGGGYPVGAWTAVGARPGGSKTSWLMQSARRCPKPALVIAMEEVRDLAHREIATAIRKSAVEIAGRSFSGAAELGAAVRAHEAMRSDVFLVDGRGMDARAIAREIRRSAAEHGIGAVYVDYLNRIRHERADRYDLAIRDTMDVLDDVVGEVNIAGIIGAQLSRAVEREQRAPRMSDLRDSGAVEEIVKLGVVLHRPNADRPRSEGGDDELWAIIDKQNLGARRVRLAFDWDGPSLTISDRAKEEQQ